MKLSTKRKVYYTSVITSLVAILVCAVIINRTLVNVPEYNFEEISNKAGECVHIYMAYVGENGETVVGSIDNDDELFAEAVAFAENISLTDLADEDSAEKKKLSAWLVMYDDKNRIASRLNFYNSGNLMWYDGESYIGSPEVMNELINYCDRAVELSSLEIEND